MFEIIIILIIVFSIYNHRKNPKTKRRGGHKPYRGNSYTDTCSHYHDSNVYYDNNDYHNSHSDCDSSCDFDSDGDCDCGCDSNDD